MEKVKQREAADLTGDAAAHSAGLRERLRLASPDSDQRKETKRLTALESVFLVHFISRLLFLCLLGPLLPPQKNNI